MAPSPSTQSAPSARKKNAAHGRRVLSDEEPDSGLLRAGTALALLEKARAGFRASAAVLTIGTAIPAVATGGPGPLGPQVSTVTPGPLELAFAGAVP